MNANSLHEKENVTSNFPIFMIFESQIPLSAKLPLSSNSGLLTQPEEFPQPLIFLHTEVEFLCDLFVLPTMAPADESCHVKYNGRKASYSVRFPGCMYCMYSHVWTCKNCGDNHVPALINQVLY